MSKLPVLEFFDTLQGEGFYAGNRAFFIRLSGCDVGCHWCDTKYSWENNSNYVSVEKIIDNVIKTGSKLVVITGGEPTIHNLESLTKELKKNNIYSCIETAGCYKLKGEVNWFCLSPKKRKPPLKKSFELANELKVIVYNKNDITWAEKNARLVKKDCKLYLQPEWSVREEILPFIIDYIRENQNWKLSLQVHKYIGID